MRTSRRIRRRATTAIVLVTVGLAALAACGSNPSPPRTSPTPTAIGTSPTGEPTQTPTQTTAQPFSPGATQSTTPNPPTLSVYFFSRLSKGRLAPVARPTASPAVLANSLRALSAGPNQAELAAGFTTQLPPGIDVRDVELGNGIAAIALTATHDEQPTASAQQLLADAALAQLVFTATQFPTVKAVTVQIDGQHATAPHQSDESPGNAELLDRTDFEDWSPAVLVESPVIDTTIHSPVRIRGTANTFEAVFKIEITDWDGRIVAARTVMASSGSGTRGTFDVTLPYSTDRTGVGEIITSVQSAKDGSRITVTEVPVVVAVN